MCFNLKTKRQRGFTLIELLIVVAIVGILTATVVVNINATKNSAKDKSIMTNLTSVRDEAEMMFNEANSYAGMCNGPTSLGSSGNLSTLQSGIIAKNGSIAACYGDISAYCVEASLPGGDSFCVDSTNYAGTTAACAVGNIKCAP